MWSSLLSPAAHFFCLSLHYFLHPLCHPCPLITFSFFLPFSSAVPLSHFLFLLSLLIVTAFTLSPSFSFLAMPFYLSPIPTTSFTFPYCCIFHLSSLFLLPKHYMYTSFTNTLLFILSDVTQLSVPSFHHTFVSGDDLLSYASFSVYYLLFVHYISVLFMKCKTAGHKNKLAILAFSMYFYFYLICLFIITDTDDRYFVSICSMTL